jgi:hypothetical protein
VKEGIGGGEMQVAIQAAYMPGIYLFLVESFIRPAWPLPILHPIRKSNQTMESIESTAAGGLSLWAMSDLLFRTLMGTRRMKEWLWKAGRTCSGANQKRVRPGSDTLGKRYSNMSQTTFGLFLWVGKHAHLKALSQSEKDNDRITNIRIQR